MSNSSNGASQVLTVNCWHDSNKGDAAITIGLLNALVASNVSERLAICSYASYATPQETRYAFRHVLSEFPEAGVVPTSLPALVSSVGKGTALRLALRGVFKLIFPNLLPDHELEKAIRNSCAVASTGGLYFGFVKGSFADLAYHLYSFSYPLLFARRVGVPYFLYAQSFGPFHGGFAAWWMRRLIANSTGTWPLESYSQDTLLELGVPKEQLRGVADAAFGIDPAAGRKKLDLSRYGLEPLSYVAISLRGLVSAGHDRHLEDNYRAVFQETIKWLVKERGLTVVLVAHTIGPLEKEDDRIISTKLWETIDPDTKKNTVLAVDDLSPVELAQLYGSARMVIATRFHAVVLALCGGTPVIAIPYFGKKTQGSLRDMGLSDFVIDLESLTPALLQGKSDAVIQGGEGLRERIRDVAKERYTAAMDTGKRLKDLALHGPPS
jgi:polysaccharide pyruvyl transferase WcaK-like protein